MQSQALEQCETREAVHLDCIHCGICLSACPTYLQLGNEADSPRGRIYLINAMKEGRVEPGSPGFRRHIQLCLECRACETACPSGVHFSAMMNEARFAIQERHRFSTSERFARWLVFRVVFPNRALIRLAFRLLSIYQRTGIRRLVRSSRLLKLFPGRVEQMETLLPEVPKPFRRAIPEVAQARVRGRVSLFLGCIMPELFGAAHRATIRVLERNGMSVVLPPRQTCCGALHLHGGDLGTARELARRNIAAFEEDGSAAIIVNAAGCGAILKEYDELLADDPAYAERARAFCLRVSDISEYLASIGIDKNMERLDLKVTYDDPCHLLHAQGIREAPRRLLRMIPGVQFVELRDADRCCGSAGVYNITHPEMSERILDEKIAEIVRTGAQVVATGNPGCLLQIQAGLRARNVPVQVRHPIELLDDAYQGKLAKYSRPVNT